ncbi:MAG TPA: pre-toxin TG domain-containing protein [Bdellovibrionales bacterium]|nr:pre-toxin TG domain-containing protein [Bdellovibrionales bacterium]
MHDELLASYITLKSRAGTKVVLLPFMRVTLPFESYCLNPYNASPESREVYHWQTSESGVRYLKELLSLRRAGEANRSEIQEIIWNLKSGTHWEDYPSRLKAILLRVDPNASLKLPSGVKSEMQNLLMGELLSIPGVSEAREQYDVVKGKFRNYQDFKESIESLSSKHSLPTNDELSQIPGTSLYSESQSDGYSSQDVTFYNPTSRLEEIDLTNFYLASSRPDVQPIALNVVPNSHSSLLAELEEALFGSMARLGIGFIPVVNDAADLYEVFVGRDFASGERLSSSERALSALGLAIGSGAGYRFAQRAVHSPPAYLDDFSRGLERTSGKAVGLTSSTIGDAQEAVAIAAHRAEPLKQNIRKLKEAVSVLKDNNISRQRRREIVNAFTPGSSVKTMNADTTVYRYYQPGVTLERANWVTTEKLTDPVKQLALPNKGTYEIKEWTLPKGTKVIDGLVAPNFNEPGGARQIFVPNQGALL